MKCRLESLGVYLPDNEISTASLIEAMETPPMFDLEKLTGVKNRRWRAPEDDSLTLALAAAERCLSASAYNAEDLDVLIFTSITRFTDGLKFCVEPSMSLMLKQKLGLPSDALQFDITNACAGMMTGLSLLEELIRSGTVKRGMVVSGECITTITETAVKEIREPIDPQFASLTVGDSGAAFIMDESTGEEGIDFIDLFTIAKFADLCYGMPSDKNPGVAMYTKAMEIHGEVIQRLPATLGHYTKIFGISAATFEAAIPHQTSSRAIRTALELCEENFGKLPKICINLDQYGNTSTTSHSVVFAEFWKQEEIKPGDRVLFLVLASGIVMGAVGVTVGDIGVNA